MFAFLLATFILQIVSTFLSLKLFHNILFKKVNSVYL